MKTCLLFILFIKIFCLIRNSEYIIEGNRFRNSVSLLQNGFGLDKNGRIKVNITINDQNSLNDQNLNFVVIPFDTFVILFIIN
jgi:hypothetical protein